MSARLTEMRTTRAVRVLDASAVLADGVPHDNVYASAGYGRAAARHDAWMVAIADGWRLPFVVSGPPDARVAASPYGYGGICIAANMDAGRAADLWRATRSALHDLGVVSLFLRFPPYLPLQAEAARALPGLEVQHVSDTVLVATGTDEAMWSAMAPSCRNKVRKAEKAGLTSHVEDFTADDPAVLAEFRSIYDDNMERLHAMPSLRFDDDYYRVLCSGVHRPMMQITVRNAGRAIASSILMQDDDVLHDHLGATTIEGNELAARNLMLWTALRAARERGLGAVHLGGGRHADDSLFRFKASFGGRAVPFHVGHAIIDAPRYRALVDARAVELGTSSAALEATHYFPAFMATVPEEP